MGTKSGATADSSLQENAGLLWFCAVLAPLVFVKVEVFGLLAEKPLGLVGKIFAALDGLLAGKVKTRLSGQGAEDSKPAFGGFSEGLERLSNIGVTVGIDVKVGAELVHEGGEVLEFLIEAMSAGERFGP